MKAKIAFYKVSKGNWIDKLIGWWTKSEYSHSELVIDQWWYSISPRDVKLRRKNIQPNPEHWDYVDVEIDELWFKVLYKKYEGCGYDWLGIALTEWLPLNVEHPKKFYCSEWCAKVIGYSPAQMSPQKLWEKINE